VFGSGNGSGGDEPPVKIFAAQGEDGTGVAGMVPAEGEVTAVQPDEKKLRRKSQEDAMLADEK